MKNEKWKMKNEKWKMKNEKWNHTTYGEQDNKGKLKKEEKEPPSTARRDHLLEIEKSVQELWKQKKPYEVDVTDEDVKKQQPEHKDQSKFFATFPYPYMNGVLHLGHAFTLSKAEFSSRYQRLKGKKVLFPFGFHCTGMPIAVSGCACGCFMSLYLVSWSTS